MSALSAYMPALQKGTANHTIDDFETPCISWKLYSGTLEEQLVLLTAEPSLQALFCSLTQIPETAFYLYIFKT